MDGISSLEEVPSLVFEQPKSKPLPADLVTSDEASGAESTLSDAEEQEEAAESFSAPEDEVDGLEISSSSDDAQGESEDADFELESHHDEDGNEEEEEEDEDDLLPTSKSRRMNKKKTAIEDFESNPDLYGLRRSVSFFYYQICAFNLLIIVFQLGTCSPHRSPYSEFAIFNQG